MSETRAERSTFVFRILYLGSSGARKFDAVKRLHAALPADETEPMTLLVAGSETIVSFRFRPKDVKILGFHDVAYDVHVCPGRFRKGAAHRLLVRSADAVIFMVDGDSKDPHRDFDEVVACLGSLGKKPEDLPLVVAMDEKVEVDDWAREARSEWHPWLHRIGESAADVVDVFLSCGKAVCGHTEERLGRRGTDAFGEPGAIEPIAGGRSPAPADPLGQGLNAEFTRPLTQGTAARLQSLDLGDDLTLTDGKRSSLLVYAAAALFVAALAWWVVRLL